VDPTIIPGVDVLDESLCADAADDLCWKTGNKLPDTVKPTHYTISIHPNLTTLDVTGTKTTPHVKVTERITFLTVKN